MQTLTIDHGVKSPQQTGIPQPKRRVLLRILHTLQPRDSFVVDRQLDAEYVLQLGTELGWRMKVDRHGLFPGYRRIFLVARYFSATISQPTQ